MTITGNPPTGVFRITPDDGGIYAFEIGRAPEFGNVQDHDLGQTVARSEGTQVYVLGKAVEANLYRLKFFGLTSHEFHYLRLYIQDQLQGSSEKATFEWGRARNRILYSSTVAARDSENYTNWQKLGATPPIVTDNQIMNPEGFLSSASRVVFGGSAGDSALRCPGVLDDFTTGLGYVSVSFMAKVIDVSGDYDIRVDSSAPGFFDATIPDSGIGGGQPGGWHRISGSYTGWLATHLDIQNNEAGTRSIGITDVQMLWHPTRPIEPTFYDPVPLRTILSSRYVPDSIVGRQIQGDMWNVEFLVREEVA